MRDNLNALKILRLQTFHPKALRSFSNSRIYRYRKVKVSLCRQHSSFCLSECRIFIRLILIFWFLSSMQWILCSQYLSLCMTQRSCFLLNICLWLLLHFQLFLFSPLKHLKSLGFISILCLWSHIFSFIIFIFLSFFLHFVGALELAQCFTDLIFHSAYSILYCYSILSYFIFGVLKVLSSFRNLPSHLIQCLSLRLSITLSRGQDVLHSTTNDPIF